MAARRQSNYVLGKGADAYHAAREIPSWREVRDWMLRGKYRRSSSGCLLWTPVAFGVGAAIYLGLKSEPRLLTTTLLVCEASWRAIAVDRRVPSRGGAPSSPWRR